jgi:cell division septation protein DedD
MESQIKSPNRGSNFGTNSQVRKRLGDKLNTQSSSRTLFTFSIFSLPFFARLRRAIKVWQLTLNFSQFLISALISLSAVALSYYIGFSSGIVVGSESIRIANAAHLAKLPVVPPILDRASAEEVASAIYKDLESDQPNPSTAGEKGATDLAQVAIAGGGEIKDLLKDGENGSLSQVAEALQNTRVETDRAPDKVTPGESGLTKSAPQNSIRSQPTDQLGQGWYAQIAAPSREMEAIQVAESLNGLGFPSVVEKARIGGEIFYRVLIGPEVDKKIAQRLVTQLQREPLVKSVPFLRQIK